jgi:hypothetical protein
VRIWDNLAIGTSANTNYTLQVGGTANITGTITTNNIDNYNLNLGINTSILPIIPTYPTITSNTYIHSSATAPFLYQNGTYIFSGSSLYATGNQFYFSGFNATGWSSQIGYNTTNGTYTGNKGTTITTQAILLGEFLEVNLPYSTNLTKITFTHYGINSLQILGKNSTDSTAPYVLIQSVSISNTASYDPSSYPYYNTNTTINITNTNYYTYYRFVVSSYASLSPSVNALNYANITNLKFYGNINDQYALQLKANDGVSVVGSITTTGNITATGNLTYQPRYKSSWTAVNQSSGNVAFNLPFTMDFENLPIYKVLYCDGTSATPAFGNTYDITGSIKNYQANTGVVIKYTSATQVTINLSVAAIAWYETSYFTSGRIRLILY